MKKTLLSLLLLAATLFANAETYKGGRILCDWNTDSSYNILVQTFLPCTGPSQPVPDSIYVCYFNSCNTTSGTMVLHFTGDSVKSAPQIRSYLYAAEFVVPSACDHWTFYTSLAGRDSAVNVYSANSNIYLEATLNTTVNYVSLSGVQPGPSYNPFLLTNVPWTIPGIPLLQDTVIYETIMPRTAPANYLNPGLCQSSYAATDLSFTDTMYNLTDNPIATNHTYTLNPNVGTRHFTPSAAGLGKNIIAIKATQYKSGVIVGTSMIDQEYTIVPDTGYHQIYQYLDTNSIVGGYFDGNNINVEVDSTVEFCIISTCENTQLNVFSNNGVSLPGSTVTSTTSNDTIRTCFTWTPSDTSVGGHILVAVTNYANDTTLCNNSQLIIDNGQLNVPINVTSPTSVNNLSNNNSFKIFPNPAQNKVFVEAPTAVQLTITGLDGKILLQRSNANSIDIGNLPDGMYLLRIADLNGRLMKMEKLIKTATK